MAVGRRRRRAVLHKSRCSVVALVAAAPWAMGLAGPRLPARAGQRPSVQLWYIAFYHAKIIFATHTVMHLMCSCL